MFVFVSFIFVWTSPLWLPIGAIFEPEQHAWLRINWILMPLHAILLFGLYSGSIVMYRIFLIKDHPESKQELLKDIEKARQNLEKAGFRSD